MNGARTTGVVVDTMVISWLFADQPHPLADRCADLRHRCQKLGHALGNKVHDGDRWIAAAAIRLAIPLASHDGVFERTPGLELLTAREP